jgi:hypothetical protein
MEINTDTVWVEISWESSKNYNAFCQEWHELEIQCFENRRKPSWMSTLLCKLRGLRSM